MYQKYQAYKSVGTRMNGTLNICLLKPNDVVTCPEELQYTTMYALGMLPFKGSHIHACVGLIKFHCSFNLHVYVMQ